MRKTFYETGEIYIVKQWNEGEEEGNFTNTILMEN